MTTENISFLRRKDLESMLGLCRASIYNHVDRGLLPPPVPLGLRSVGWPSNEINAVFSARIAGHSSDQIKILVSQLVADRKLAA